MNDLIKVLEKKRSELKMSYRRFAAYLGFSHNHVIGVMKQETGITWDFCAAIAPKVGLSPIDAFKLAGLLSSDGSGDNGKC